MARSKRWSSTYLRCGGWFGLCDLWAPLSGKLLGLSRGSVENHAAFLRPILRSPPCIRCSRCQPVKKTVVHRLYQMEPSGAFEVVAVLVVVEVYRKASYCRLLTIVCFSLSPSPVKTLAHRPLCLEF